MTLRPVREPEASDFRFKLLGDSPVHIRQGAFTSAGGWPLISVSR